MARRRHTSWWLAVTSLALLTTALPGTSSALAAEHAPPPSAAYTAYTATSPSGAAFGANSCVYVIEVSQYSCTDLGWYSTAGKSQAFAESVGPAQAFEPAGTVADAPTGNPVTLPAAVSCAGDSGLTVPCEMVGSHYSQVRSQAELTESYDGSGTWTVQTYRNPRGTTWSELSDTSCLSETPIWCVQVGDAGTSKLTSNRVVYTSHAIAYSLIAPNLTQLRVPAPAGAKNSKLTGVSCWRYPPWKCLAVGAYTNSRGTWLPYAAMLTSKSWHLETVPRAHGQASAVLNSIACPTISLCVAAGVSHSPGTHPFAVRWSSGRWTTMTTPKENSAGFNSVSCVGSLVCYAVGWHGVNGLVEAWIVKAASWTLQPIPGTPSPDTGNMLAHVSCADFTGGLACQAVGYRYDPATAPAHRTYQTLADLQTGTGWTLQTTPNP